MAILRPSAALLLVGCGLGAASGGGSENLPVSGTGPFLELDQPYLLSEPGIDLGDPSAIALPQGGFRIWYTRAGTEIWRADLAALDQPAAPPVKLLVADQSWEGDAVRAPSVATSPTGFTMVYQAGGMVGVAESSDGIAFTKTGPIGAGVDPTVLYLGSQRIVYVGGDQGIRRLDDAADPVLSASADRSLFDSAAVAQPAAAFGLTVAGRTWIGLLYTGTGASGATAIGVAGSEDGWHFTRAPRGRPILPPLGENQAAPSAPVVLGDRAVLFFQRRRAGKLAIAAAVSTAQ